MAFRSLLLLALAAALPAHAQQGSAEKLDHYVKGFNVLVGTFGLQVEYRAYAAQQIARKTVNDPVSVSDGWLEQGDDELKQGQAAGGDLAQADAAAARMVPILDRLVERLRGLDAYYESRGQLEDNFARGKREDRLVLADFQAALAALPPLSDALDDAIDRRDTQHLLELQQQGDMVGFNGGLALQEAKRLMALLRDPRAAHDPKVIAQADTLADAMSQALADETTALATAKATGDDRHPIRDSSYGIAAERLQSLIGAYRELKRGNPAGHMLMEGAYNSAIETVNVGQ